MRFRRVLMVLYACLSGIAEAAPPRCENRLGGLPGCAVLDGKLTGTDADGISELTQRLQDFGVAAKRVQYVNAGLFNASAACAATWDLFWCLTSAQDLFSVCDADSNRLRVCGAVVREYGRCAGNSQGEVDEWLRAFSDHERDGCFGSAGVKGMLNVSALVTVEFAATSSPSIGTTPEPAPQTSSVVSNVTTTPVSSTRAGASSTGSLPLLATPAPLPVKSSAGKATVVSWTGVALCGWCTFCQWCKN
jgi:hypothetical protein